MLSLSCSKSAITHGPSIYHVVSLISDSLKNSLHLTQRLKSFGVWVKEINTHRKCTSVDFIAKRSASFCVLVCMDSVSVKLAMLWGCCLGPTGSTAGQKVWTHTYQSLLSEIYALFYWVIWVGLERDVKEAPEKNNNKVKDVACLLCEWQLAYKGAW